jgi:hypothetical protein
VCVAGGESAAAQAGQRVRLVPGAADAEGHFQGLLVTRLRLREGTADPAQRPYLDERVGLATQVTEVPIALLSPPGPGCVGG